MRRFLRLTVLIAGMLLVCLFAVTLMSASSRRDTSIGDYLTAHVQSSAGTWCWINICPKQTPLDQAKARVKTSDAKIIQDFSAAMLVEFAPKAYLSFDSIDGSHDPVRVISFALPVRSMSLGDAYQLFGMPIAVQRRAEGPIWHRRVCFRGGLCADFDGAKSRVSPYLWITGFNLYGADAPISTFVFQPWTGFIYLSFR